MLKIVDKLLNCSLDKLSGANALRLPLTFQVKGKTFSECVTRLEHTELECTLHCLKHGEGFQIPTPDDKTDQKASRGILYFDGRNAKAELGVVLSMKVPPHENAKEVLATLATTLDRIVAFSTRYDSDKAVKITIDHIRIVEEKGKTTEPGNREERDGKPTALDEIPEGEFDQI